MNDTTTTPYRCRAASRCADRERITVTPKVGQYAVDFARMVEFAVPNPGRPPLKDMAGQRYGRLIGLYPTGAGTNGMKWMFRCDCGNQHEAAGYHVRKGRIQSCGCYQDERNRTPGGRRQDGYQRVPLADRLWQNVEERGECWVWTGSKNDRCYGHIAVVDDNGQWRKEYTHRVAWQLMRGEIPDDLELDHLCRNTLCVNPWHLDPVTHQENVRRSQMSAEAHMGLAR